MLSFMSLISYRKFQTFVSKLQFNPVNSGGTAQVRISEADNMAQYWPNLGNQQSAIFIEPVSPFASVKCWPDDGGLCRLFKFTDLQPKFGPVSALYQDDCYFSCGIQFRNYKSQSPAHGRHITGPCVTFITEKHNQLHTEVIIPETARYWQPIFGNIFADAGPVLGRI